MDAIWFGHAPISNRFTGTVIGVVRFIDKGNTDDKWLLTDGRSLTHGELLALQHFFRGYATFKNLLEFVSSRAMNSHLVDIEFSHKS